MNEYPKIHTVYKRDPLDNHKTLLVGQYTLPEFEYLANNTWVWTEKVDGTNIRVTWKDGGFSFQGKTDAAQVPTSLLKRLSEKFVPLTSYFVDLFPAGVCFYGEGYGAKIQKGGGNYRPDQDFVLFDIQVGPWWLKREDVEVIGGRWGLNVVPIVGQGTLPEMVKMARAGFVSKWGSFLAEGIIARPQVELQTRAGGRIITKIKTKDFVGGKEIGTQNK